MTLTSRALGRPSLTKQIALVLGGSLLIALSAQVSVPFVPVPMSLQTLAILLVGFAYGARLGAATVLAYLAQGAMGLPVFAGGASTLALVGPTAGFLVGFVGMAWLAGLAAERMSGALPLAAAGLAISLLLYVPGLAWPMAVSEAMGVTVWGQGVPLPDLLGAFMTPFLLGDAVKAVLAALIVTGALAALRRRG
jgi:biotin transport system substrate-specific component